MVILPADGGVVASEHDGARIGSGAEELESRFQAALVVPEECDDVSAGARGEVQEGDRLPQVGACEVNEKVGPSSSLGAIEDFLPSAREEMPQRSLRGAEHFAHFRVASELVGKRHPA